jgi:hypothetical protein
MLPLAPSGDVPTPADLERLRQKSLNGLSKARAKDAMLGVDVRR